MHRAPELGAPGPTRSRAWLRMQDHRLARLDDVNQLLCRVRRQSGAEAVDRVVRGCSDVPERSPVVWDEGAGTEGLEQRERVLVGQVAAAEPRFPRWGIPDGQQRDIERP